MATELTIDAFLDEMISAYGSIWHVFSPSCNHNRMMNPEYKAVYTYYKEQQAFLHTYIKDGLFVDSACKEEIVTALRKAISLLKIIDRPVLRRDGPTEQEQLIKEATRLLRMSILIDTLEDN